MKKFLQILMLQVCIISGTISPSFATVFDVNSIAITNTGSGTSGTLLYCITQANLSTGPHTISFSMAGTIYINSNTALLPALNQSITIDATTAPGYTNTPVVILNGSGLAGGDGLEITASYCALYGLEITLFPYRGIYVNGINAGNFIIGAPGKGNVITLNGYYGISVEEADNGIITYNRVGTDVTGSSCAGNGYDGIDLYGGADNNQILFNHVSCNGYNGIQIGGSSNNIIQGNIIGPLAGTCNGNLYRGVDIEDYSNNNIVGGTIPSEFNKIGGNDYWGIEVKNFSTNNHLSGNSYLCNDYGAIALDNGGNSGILPPSISSANGTTISGNATASATVEVFKSQNTNLFQCSSTPSNQGADFLGSTTSSATGAWTLSGTFGGYVTATVTDASGNTSEFSTTVYTGVADTLVNACSGNIVNVTAAISSSANAICQKECVDFIDQSQNAVAWHWYFPGGTPDTSTQQSPVNICYNLSGTFTVTMAAFDVNGDSAVAVLNIIVNPTPPFPIVTLQGDTLISTPAPAYQWYFNTLPVAGATNQEYIATQSGFYYVEVSDSAGCVSQSVAMFVDFTGISSPGEPYFAATSLAEAGMFQLQSFGMPGGEARLSVYDLQGKRILEEEFTLNSEWYSRNVTLKNAAKGMYFARLETHGFQFVQKVILQ